MAKKNQLQEVVNFIRDLLEPVVKATGDPEMRKQVTTALGLNPTASTISVPAGTLASIDSYRKQAADDADIEAFLSTIRDLGQIIHALEGFISAARAGSNTTQSVDQLVNAYLSLLTVNYLRVRNPGFYITMKALQLIDEQSLRYGGVVELFTATGRFFKDLYPGLDSEDDANKMSDGILFLVGVLATVLLKADILYGFDPDPASTSSLADKVSDRVLSLAFTGETDDGSGNTVKGKLLASFVWVPKDHKGRGLLMRIKGSGSVKVPLASGFAITIGVDAPDALIFLGEGGTQFPSSTDAAVSLKLEQKSRPEDPTIVGNPKGTHLLFEKSGFEGKLSTQDYLIKGGVEKAVLTLSGKDADAFINKILPSGGEAKVDLKLVLGYSKLRGFFLEGGAGLLVSIPLHKELGPIQLQTLVVGLKAGFKEKSEIDLEASLSFAVKLGGLTASIDRIGLASEIAFPVQNGNLGNAKLTFDFKPPNGVGLAVDGGGFKGGGFLYFEPDAHRYAGALELEFNKWLTLKAIGLLTTKLPDGSDGFSLLIIITAEFQGFQLGFGFTLNGVGGLLGLNRTTKIDILRQGIKSNALASVLFPKNIVANAPKIISDLRQIFPPEEGKFVFGPMAKIGWGTPTLLTIELGLIIEVPSPVRIAMLGIFRAILPDEKLALLRIQVNFLGAWEEDKQLISFDAGLFDSRLLRFPLAGDMAFRLGYGNNPAFLISVGGFHPSFKPPPLALPSLARISFNLLSGNNPKLALSCYFAITSNTVQFGAKIELLAKAWKFNVYGFLAFDALFQFSPFYFIVQIAAGVAVRIGSAVLFSIGLKLSLEGPTPWAVKGTASFRICFFIKVKVRFSKTWGEKKDTSLPDVAVLPLLEAALKEKGNWQARLPSRSRLLVSLREMDDVAGDRVVAHPAGVLTVAQKIVPLDVNISKFGSQKPSDGKRFSISKVRSNGTELRKSSVKEFFAPAQFEDLSDAQKLSRKSFEQMPAGVEVKSTSNDIQSSRVVSRELAYETLIIDTRFRILRLAKALGERLGTFFALLKGSSVGRSALSATQLAEPVLGPGKVAVVQEGFSVVSVDDLKPLGAGASFGSQAEAVAHMKQLTDSNPALQGNIQVVPDFESIAA